MQINGKTASTIMTYLTVAFIARKAESTAGVEIEGIVSGSTSQKKVSFGGKRVGTPKVAKAAENKQIRDST